jgi:hypothetical protein
LTVLENPLANPGLARAIFRGLAAKGGTANRVPFLHELCPPGAGDYEERDSDARAATIALLNTLGIIAIDGDSLRLTLAEVEWPAGETVDSFRGLMNGVFMQTVATLDPFSRGTAAFCSAIAWLLAQDPLRPIERWNRERHGEGAERLQQQNLTYADRLVFNETQWRSFASWACFLGFAERVRVRSKPYLLELVVPDPTSAIQAALPLIAGASARQFLLTLASFLPVLDHGKIRLAVESRWQGDPPPSPVSPALSVALLRLESLGAITLKNVPDSPPDERIVLHTGTGDRTVSLIEVGDPNE